MCGSDAASSAGKLAEVVGRRGLLPEPLAHGLTEFGAMLARSRSKRSRRHRGGLSWATLCLLVRWLLITGCTVLAAQAETRSVDVVLVLSSRAAPFRTAADEFASCLRQHGRTSRVIVDPSPAQAAELTRADGPLVATIGSSATSLLATQTKVPMVYCMVADPERAGVTTRERAVGVTTAVPLSEQFDLVTRAVPTCRRVGMLHRSGAAHGVDPERVRAALPDALQLEAVDIDRHASVAEAIDELLLQRGVDVIWTAPDASVYDAPTIKALLLRAVRVRTPVFGYSESFVRAGALLGVAVEPAQQGRQAAALAQSLLEASPIDPAEIWVPRAPSYSLIVNKRVAQHLGIELPADLIEQAATLVEER